MRFIIRELDYERPLATGKLRYQVSGRSTGVTEEWRLTAAAEMLRFLRVDLDAREGSGGDSALYHLVLDRTGRPERLKFRYYGPALTVTGDLLFDQDAITLTRFVNGRRFEQELAVQPPTAARSPRQAVSAEYAFCFPSSLGLSLLAPASTTGSAGMEDKVVRQTAITLTSPVPGKTADDDAFSMQSAEVALQFDEPEEVTIGHEAIRARPLLIDWGQKWDKLWLDERGNLPVKRLTHNRLSAVETRYVRYEPHSVT